MESEDTPFWAWCRARNIGGGQLFYLAAMEEAWEAATQRAARIAREAVAEDLADKFPDARRLAEQIAADIEGNQP